MHIDWKKFEHSLLSERAVRNVVSYKHWICSRLFKSLLLYRKEGFEEDSWSWKSVFSRERLREREEKKGHRHHKQLKL